jgi:FkbM family methyltransferase
MWFVQKFFRLPVTYRFREGGSLYCEAQDRCDVLDVWLERSYDPNYFGIPFDWSRCKRIIDIGAHIGAFSLFALIKAPSAEVLAFEPVLASFRRAQENALQFKGRSVSVRHCGIGPEKGTASITIDGGGSSQFRQGQVRETISLEPLRDLLHEPCDFLKMDCEGAEYEALYSLTQDECSRIKFLALEYHHFSKEPGHNPNVLTQWLAARGFQITMHKKSMLLAYRE